MECELILRGHTGGVRSLELLPNGYLVSASYDKTVRIWSPSLQIDTASYNPKDSSPYLVKILNGHLSSVLCL